jgi:hypothetical protein
LERAVYASVVCSLWSAEAPDLADDADDRQEAGVRRRVQHVRRVLHPEHALADRIGHAVDARRDGDRMRFVVDNGYGGDDYFVEQVSESRKLFDEGIADVTIADNGIAGTFAAEIRCFVVGQQPWLGHCSATDHRMSFTR